LLAHAEIESYLEDRAIEVATDAVARWRVDLKAERVILGLIAFHHSQEPVTRLKLKDLHTKNQMHAEETVLKANQRYHYVLANNHGIKEENVLQLLLPLGVRPSEIDSAWLSTIDSFASARGKTAHKSVKTQQPPDPKTERDNVKQILEGLKEIDKMLGRLKR